MKKTLVAHAITEATMKQQLENLKHANAEVKANKLTVEGMFEVAMVIADYQISVSNFAEGDWSNGTGYYDPLCFHVFEDADGDEVEAGSSISVYDVKTSRRLYILVVEPGVNLVFHDRFSTKEGGTIVLSSDIAQIRTSVGIEEPWCKDVPHDMAMLAHLLGIEYSRSNNHGYVPWNHRPLNSVQIGMKVAKNLQAALKRRMADAL